MSQPCPCCVVSLLPSRPPVSCGCEVWSPPGWYVGVSPGTCPVGNHYACYAYGTVGEGIGCGCCELLDSFLALILVNLSDTELLRASSCETRDKVSSGDLYKRSSRLGNRISFVYPRKKNTRFSAALYFR